MDAQEETVPYRIIIVKANWVIYANFASVGMSRAFDVKVPVILRILDVHPPVEISYLDSLDFVLRNVRFGLNC